MAHLALWLTACGVVLLCVAAPHVSGHPTFDKSPHEEMPPHQMVMPYYPQAQPPQQYYPSYEGEGEEEEEEEEPSKEKINLRDFEPVLADKVVDKEMIWWNSRSIDAMIILGYIYFLYNVFRPDNYFPWTNVGRKLNDEDYPSTNNITDYPSSYNITEYPSSFNSTDYTSSYNSNVTNSIMSDAFTLIMNSVDPVEMGMNILSVDARECRNRLVCEARHMVATIPVLDILAQQYGWLLGSVPKYQEALSEGRSRGDCGQKFSQCPKTDLTRFYDILL